MYVITVLLCMWITFCIDLTRGQEYETSNGLVRGRTISILGKSMDVFHGIPFAKPPVGDLRFKHPQPAESWRPETKNATEETPSCFQPTQEFGDSRYYTDDLRSPPDELSEDCLYLSIWKPSSATNGSNLAVMVWIYGGGFSIGSTRLPLYNGQYLAAENDVIVVSINYRVGPLGFAYLGSDNIPGNMGLMDQVEGLKWVKENIATFGGDTDRITLFGESAGAFSIGYHLVSPLTWDLFNNTILQSGSPVHSISNALVLSASEARNNIVKLSEAMNCSGSSDTDVYACLNDANPQTITDIAAQPSLGALFYPVEDGYYLPSKPIDIIEKGEHIKTNILTGVNKDEATYFFYLFLNLFNKTLISTGEEFNYQHFQMMIPALLGVADVGRTTALRYFFESQQSPPRDYLQILNDLVSDFTFKCPSLQFSSLYTEFNDVYLYSVNHRLSTMQLPEWMGVPHSYEIELVFGHPLNDSLGFTLEEKELSRNIMKYWTNFAKSGNPNSPEAITTDWPAFDPENTTYLALNTGSNLAPSHGFRRHQCAFINDILPMIPQDPSSPNPVTTTTPGSTCTSGSRGVYTGSVSIIISLLTGLFWMLQDIDVQ